MWEHTAGHPIPGSAASWFYVFGSATLLCFILQIITGSLLAFVYVPSASEAYDSLLYLTYEQDLGWYMRAMHYGIELHGRRHAPSHDAGLPLGRL